MDIERWEALGFHDVGPLFGSNEPGSKGFMRQVDDRVFDYAFSWPHIDQSWSVFTGQIDLGQLPEDFVDSISKTVRLRIDMETIEGSGLGNTRADLAKAALHMEIQNRYEVAEICSDSERADALLESYFDEVPARSNGGPNAYGNPNAGNHIIVQGSSRTWRGTGSGMEVYEDFRSAVDNAPSYRMLVNVFADCEMQKVWDENGSLFLSGAHHDGGVCVEMRQLTDKGEGLLSEYLGFEGGLILPDSPVAMMGSTYGEGDEGRFLNDLWSEEELCARPRYMERAFGCPIEEYAVERDGSGITFRIKKIDRDTLTYDEGYRFDVQVLTDGYDCGNGRFCKSLDEAHEYCVGIGYVQKYPNQEKGIRIGR